MIAYILCHLHLLYIQGVGYCSVETNYFHDITRPVLLLAKDESVFLERLRVPPVAWACLASAIACSSS